MKAQYNRYYRGKKNENGEELPLSKVPGNRKYIAYGKGAIAFYEISTSIGTDRFHSILRDYVSKYSYTTDTYPTTLDFIDLLKDRTTGEEHHLIENWLNQTNSLD